MTDSPTPPPPEDIDIAKEDAFMRLFLQSERRILGFILALVPHLPDAEDLLQETWSSVASRYLKPGE